MNRKECLKEALFIAIMTFLATIITQIFMIYMQWEPAELNLYDSIITTGLIIGISMIKCHRHQCNA
jgi:cytochrome c oxidase subunit IV